MTGINDKRRTAERCNIVFLGNLDRPGKWLGLNLLGRVLAFADAWWSYFAIVERASDQHASNDNEDDSIARQGGEDCGYSKAADAMD